MHQILVRSTQALNHILLFYGLYLIIFQGVSWTWLLVSYAFFFVVGMLGINIGYHRLISHKSFKTYKPLEYLFALCGCVTMVGSPIPWVAVHRKHHHHTDTEDDVHSPHILGKFKAWFGFWLLQNTIHPKYTSDLRREKFYLYAHRYYFAINILYAGILTLIDPLLLIFGYAIPAVMILHCTSIIIVIAHIHGYQNHKTGDESRNSWIANLATMGEGWHNNHHANSKAWNTQENWWEFDPPAWIIRLIKV